MRSLCLFASYVEGTGVSYYTEIYLAELKKHCTDVIYLHSNMLDVNALDFFKRNSIVAKALPNEGFDFGQWQKALASINLEEYDQLLLVNDSSVLFAPLDNLMAWFNNSVFDFGGLTESTYEKKHIQSYFLIFNRSTFKDLQHFFATTKLSHSIFKVIEDFEIGLSQHLISKKYTYGVFLSNDGYNGEFAPYFKCVESHIKQGSPMIKKKILFSSYRKEELFTLARMNFNVSVNHYIQLIKKYNTNLLLSFDKLIATEYNRMNYFERVKYNIKRSFIQLYKKIKNA